MGGIESDDYRSRRTEHPASPPVGSPLPVIREAAMSCQACPLWRRATQTVFGEGPVPAALMLVGEQPGDEEDRSGHPFVGPAGRFLARALEEAGIERGDTFVTNAVKHFKWVESPDRGKRRIHDKPSTTEVSACRPWLLAEIETVAPSVIVCLGATAAQALLGRGFRVTQHRGEALPFTAEIRIVATVHPASILRARDDQDRRRQTSHFVADLHEAAELARSPRPSRRR
jgi:uracil-DNA glycosylase family protein